MRSAENLSQICAARASIRARPELNENEKASVCQNSSADPYLRHHLLDPGVRCESHG